MHPIHQGQGLPQVLGGLGVSETKEGVPAGLSQVLDGLGGPLSGGPKMMEGQNVRVIAGLVSKELLQGVRHSSMEDLGPGQAHLLEQGFPNQGLAEVEDHSPFSHAFGEDIPLHQEFQVFQKLGLGERAQGLEEGEGGPHPKDRSQIRQASGTPWKLSEAGQDGFPDGSGELQLPNLPSQPGPALSVEAARANQIPEGLLQEEGVPLGPLVKVVGEVRRHVFFHPECPADQEAGFVPSERRKPDLLGHPMTQKGPLHIRQ